MNTEIVKLNLEGEICPYPLIRTIKKVEELKEDLELGKKILEVIIDHPPALETIPSELKKRGFQVEIKKIDRVKWQILIKK